MNSKSFYLFIVIILLILTTAAVILSSSWSFAEMSTYQKPGFSDGIVNCETLNVRIGPGLNFPIVYKIHKGDKVRIFAKINNWYMIQNEDNLTGMVSSDYIVDSESYKKLNAETHSLQEAEKQVLDLVNKERKKLGLPELKIDETLHKAAKEKAKDMVSKKYFSHNSPTLGTPFEMLNKYSVKYRAAGENIAGSSSVKDAFDAWMKSKSHKDNILNKNFNYTGIGVYSSDTYGNIIVQEFVGR